MCALPSPAPAVPAVPAPPSAVSAPALAPPALPAVSPRVGSPRYRCNYMLVPASVRAEVLQEAARRKKKQEQAEARAVRQKLA